MSMQIMQDGHRPAKPSFQAQMSLRVTRIVMNNQTDAWPVWVSCMNCNRLKRRGFLPISAPFAAPLAAEASSLSLPPLQPSWRPRLPPYLCPPCSPVGGRGFLPISAPFAAQLAAEASSLSLPPLQPSWRPRLPPCLSPLCSPVGGRGSLPISAPLAAQLAAEASSLSLPPLQPSWRPRLTIASEAQFMCLVVASQRSEHRTMTNLFDYNDVQLYTT